MQIIPHPSKVEFAENIENTIKLQVKFIYVYRIPVWNGIFTYEVTIELSSIHVG